ncbi:hypothetical protein AB0C70_05250 [Streptomyces sp. NPDC048564]|uniref:hypothetical protein n=1 Tax=unclassified Streptomyces TaxID=2593676 RepID=UPI003433D821
MQQAARISPQVMESLSTPERVESHLGTLEFPLGMPTDETADRLYDHLDQVHAVRGFLDAYSGVSMWAARKGFLEAGVRDHDVLLFSEFMGPETDVAIHTEPEGPSPISRSHVSDRCHQSPWTEQRREERSLIPASPCVR